MQAGERRIDVDALIIRVAATRLQRLRQRLSLQAARYRQELSFQGVNRPLSLIDKMTIGQHLLKLPYNQLLLIELLFD